MIDLYNHQKVALSYLRSFDSFALFMEQGTGKTIVALSRILDLVKDGSAKTALIVAPKSALGAWDRDIDKFNVEDQAKLREAITSINYDSVWRGDKYKKAWDIIVLDEAHNIKNRSSRRAEFLLKLSVNAKYRYILTGTPIANGQLHNIWSLYTFLDPCLVRGRVHSNIFGGAYRAFEDRYCILNKYYQPRAYTHVNELQDIISEHSYRVKKIDCLDLPEKLPDEIVYVDFKPKTKALYARLADRSAIVELDVVADNPLSRMTKLRQLTSGIINTPTGVEEVEIEKIQILEELIEGYDDDKKLVIFAEFKHSIAKINALLDKLKIKYVTLDGDQKDKTIWRQFQSDASIKIIVCQYQTANSGIDLFASDTIIYYEPTTRSQILEQSRDRIHRTGQVNKCSYIHLITKGSIEYHIYQSLAKFSDFSEELFIKYMESYTRSYSKN